MDKLIICGLGVRVPEETTLESLQALSDCRVVYTDLEDEKGRAWLAGYCKSLKSPGAPRAVVGEAARSGGVGLAVWGNPQSSSRLARQVELAAQKAGVAYRVLGAISPIGSVFARSVSFLGGDYGYQGIQSYDLETVLADATAATTELPLVLYAERGEPARWKKALLALASNYPAGHRARLYAPQGETEAELAALKPGNRCVMLIPPAKSLGARKKK